MERLIELEEFVREITPKVNEKKIIIPNISDDEWAALKEVAEVLALPNRTTISMQKEKYTPSDFYGDWCKLKLSLEKLSHELAKEIVDCMIKREDGLLNTPTVLASVFVDPRYRLLLSDDEATVAVKHLSDIRKRLKRLKGEDVEQPSALEESNAGCDLTALIKQKKAANPFYKYEIADIDFFRPLFTLPLVDDLNTSPLDYWAKRKIADPELYQIVCVVNAAAPTQVSVERSFSGLAYILNARRVSMGDKLLQAILTVRLNASLLKKVNLNSI